MAISTNMDVTLLKKLAAGEISSEQVTELGARLEGEQSVRSLIELAGVPTEDLSRSLREKNRLASPEVRRLIEQILEIIDRQPERSINQETLDRPAGGPLPKGFGSESSMAQSAGPFETAQGDSAISESAAKISISTTNDDTVRFDSFVVEKELGHGGMGTVYLAKDVRLDRQVAIKTLKRELACQPAAVERFLREARSAAKLEHDHICPIYHVGESKGTPYIAMPFLKGEPLDAKIRREKLLSLPDVLRISREVALGLTVAHEAGLIHRDIKPANIWLETMRSGSPRVRILDFGLARTNNEEVNITASGAILGTPAYMAPEQARGDRVDARADYWSLGVMMYEMSTGKRPFIGNNTMAVLSSLALDNPAPPHKVDPTVPVKLSELIMRLLAKDPENRPSNGQRIADQLRQLQREAMAAAAKPAAPVVAPMPNAQATPPAALAAPARPDDTVPLDPFAGIDDVEPAPRKPLKKSLSGVRPAPAGKSARANTGGLPGWIKLLVPAIALFFLIAGTAVYKLVFETKNGTLIVEVDGDAEVRFKDGKVVLVGPAGKDRYTITPSERNKKIDAGEYNVRVEGADGLALDTREFTLKNGGQVTVRVTLGPKAVAKKDTAVKQDDAVAKKDAANGGPIPQPGPISAAYKNSIGMEFVKVPKGTAWLGGGGGKEGETKVVIEQDFYLGKYEVTQEEWEAVTGQNPSHFSRTGAGKDAVKDIPDADLKRFPVEQVSWDDCQLFIERLNKKEKDAGWVYRLPKEAEWEYACRGGPVDKLDSAFDFYFAKPTNTLKPEQANIFHENGLKRTCKVGSYEPNLLGLHDIHGNVWEWCDDTEKAAEGASLRVRRVGGWFNDAGGCRAAVRITGPPSARGSGLGLRLARVPAAPAGQVLAADPKPDVPGTFTNTLGMKFVPVPKGTAWLGGGGGKEGETKVVIEQDFYLGKYEVTQSEWEAVMGSNPSWFSRTGERKETVKDISDADLKRFPVEMVSWEDCQQFIKRLNEKESGWVYRLPKEAEWEYACRGGPVDKLDSAFDFYFAKPTNKLLTTQANFAPEPAKSLQRTCKVGSYEPNSLGLYDMHGNVREWCDETEKSADGASFRLIRGGLWVYDSEYCRAAYRYPVIAPPSREYPRSLRDVSLGFRLARVRSVPVGKGSTADPKPDVPGTFTNTLGMKFVPVPKGKSWLGGRNGKPGEQEVEIKADFYLGKFEVTQQEWEAITQLTPSRFCRDGDAARLVKDVSDDDLKRFPVESVSWNDCQEFIKKLNEREKETGWTYRLPTSAEWEYACRGGPVEKLDTAFDYYFAKPTKVVLHGQANVEDGKGLGRACKVGSYEPNRLGLYDMHGNVCEWLEDIVTLGNGKGRLHVGGRWNLGPDRCRVEERLATTPTEREYYLGFRLARVPLAQAGK